MSTFTKEQLIARINQVTAINKYRISRDQDADGLAMDNELFAIALASLEADPVLYAAEETLAYAKHGELHLTCLSEPMGDAVIPLYTAPTAPVAVPDERAAFNAWNNDTDCPLAGRDAKTAAWLAWSRRAAMLQSFGNSEQLSEIGSWNNHKNTPTAKPAIDTCELIKQVEGMEVSVDVSTCDADAGHRYFGTVTEVSELDTAKNGYILLVQDAEPNFKPAGNSPVIPDCWVPCSERLPEETKEPDGGATGYLVLYAEGKEPNGGFNVGVWNVTYLRQWWRGFITHWQPLPSAPQQEAE